VSAKRSAIVLVIDRLGAGFLGPYGNTWLDTPQFNRLASRSLVCETVLADSPDLALAYRAWWTGRHALEPAADSRLALPQLAKEAGLHTILLTDERAVAEQRDAVPFAARTGQWMESSGSAASELQETETGKFFLAAIDQINALREPALVWLHCRGMSGPWDAPSEFRQQFADEDDPALPDFVQPPEQILPDNPDPDELLGFVHAYAGQVALVDACLGSLLDALDESPLADQSLLAVTSPRGYPLGEHRWIGGDEALYGELLHAPLLVRLPDGAGALARSQRLVQPGDLFATLTDWLQLSSSSPPGWAQSLLPIARGESAAARELAVSTTPRERSVRSPAWFLRESVADDVTRRELFAKPDDRWEVNEVSSRCGDIAEQLAAAADQFQQAAAAGTLASLPPLAEALTDTRR
jgi:arylsulfatase A-like enzyme